MAKWHQLIGKHHLCVSEMSAYGKLIKFVLWLICKTPSGGFQSSGVVSFDWFLARQSLANIAFNHIFMQQTLFFSVNLQIPMIYDLNTPNFYF